MCMIDVIDCKVVFYFDGCDYFVFSYVWGGIMLVVDVLDGKMFFDMIEDVIVVICRFGWCYFWVDVFCID